MKYILFDETQTKRGKFDSITKLREFLTDRKYEIDCDKDISCTFDYIKLINWSFDIEE
tara:strand:- start:5116 stop:5289 length:174 start_codon:yes stop_codon:yes gene_type:complete